LVEPFGLGKRNERGKMLIDFCEQHDLIVINTWFKKRKTKLYTWKSPGDRKRYQIDYILVKLRFRNSEDTPRCRHRFRPSPTGSRSANKVKSYKKKLGTGNLNGIWKELRAKKTMSKK
jgi:hypothetical protein